MRHVRLVIKREACLKWKWRRILAYSFLALVCVVALAAPFYNRQAPRLWGLPFFIWFQMAWVIVAALATAVAHRVAGDQN